MSGPKEWWVNPRAHSGHFGRHTEKYTAWGVPTEGTVPVIERRVYDQAIKELDDVLGRLGEARAERDEARAEIDLLKQVIIHDTDKIGASYEAELTAERAKVARLREALERIVALDQRLPDFSDKTETVIASQALEKTK